jgi:hypothetical protein
MDAGISLCLKPNEMDSQGPCALCGAVVAPTGVAFFLEGSDEIVCRACAAEEAPELYALLASEAPSLMAMGIAA